MLTYTTINKSDSYDLPGDFAYRYEGLDYEGTSATLIIRLYRYRILRFTPKGYWVDNYGKEKFVLKEARKSFTKLSIAEARVSLVKRKRKQIRILERQLELATRILEAAKEFDGETETVIYPYKLDWSFRAPKLSVAKY